MNPTFKSQSSQKHWLQQQHPPRRQPKLGKGSGGRRAGPLRALRQLVEAGEGEDPQHMKLRDLIRRAEALEKLKAKEEAEAAAAVGAPPPQVRIVDGRIVIDEQRLEVCSRPRAEPARREEEKAILNEADRKSVV